MPSLKMPLFSCVVMCFIFMCGNTSASSLSKPSSVDIFMRGYYLGCPDVDDGASVDVLISRLFVGKTHKDVVDWLVGANVRSTYKARIEMVPGGRQGVVSLLFVYSSGVCRSCVYLDFDDKGLVEDARYGTVVYGDYRSNGFLNLYARDFCSDIACSRSSIRDVCLENVGAYFSVNGRRGRSFSSIVRVLDDKCLGMSRAQLIEMLNEFNKGRAITGYINNGWDCVRIEFIYYSNNDRGRISVVVCFKIREKCVNDVSIEVKYGLE